MLKLAIPLLHVSSSEAAEEFYCAGLGFRRHSAYRPGDRADPCYMVLVRDDAWLHVSSFPGDGISGNGAFVVVDDLDGLHEEFLRKGVVVDLPPTEQSWGNREMYVRDPDRNRICFARDGGGWQAQAQEEG
jgi:catechol 2,3-dioxygenase-like lactoylglutathione lyase family enzyme